MWKSPTHTYNWNKNTYKTQIQIQRQPHIWMRGVCRSVESRRPRNRGHTRYKPNHMLCASFHIIALSIPNFDTSWLSFGFRSIDTWMAHPHILSANTTHVCTLLNLETREQTPERKFIMLDLLLIMINKKRDEGKWKNNENRKHNLLTKMQTKMYNFTLSKSNVVWDKNKFI